MDVLWLSPVYPSPQDDEGYDISDYQDIDPMFGTLAEFDDLLARVHARGMKLVMDLVVNHTVGRASVVRGLARRRRQARLVLLAPPRGGRRPERADNWALVLLRLGLGVRRGGAASTTCTSSRRKQPDLNWENPEVREAVYAMMRWWLDRGIDGFRMDVINMISKDRCRGVLGTAVRRAATSAARGSTSSCRRCTARCSPGATRC